ncbi:efflux RND transporter permease subunit [Enterovibrio sp. 27052020O]|uniref:efflux RND transporter permease subunit n=1 Tax=Enterovibrio sp. 27052020O TaxID=3241166 RepID=UPI00388E54B1
MATEDSNEKPTDWVSRFLLSGFAPVLMLVALVAGAIALVLTPREEDPQIVVPMADVIISAPGLSPRQVENQITEPAEQLLSQIDGVEYVYSQSMKGKSVVIVRFHVGQNREDSLVKLYTKLNAHQDILPTSVQSWVVKPVEIDHVPIVVAALYSTSPDHSDSHDLRRIAEEMTQSLKAIDQTHQVTVSGGLPRKIQIAFDATALAAYQTTVDDIGWALSVSNVHEQAGRINTNGQVFTVETGQFFQSPRELEMLVINVVNGKPVYLKDVATISDGPDVPDSYTLFSPGLAHSKATAGQTWPAVYISVAKRKGSNAVWVADDVLAAFAEIEQSWLPDGVYLDVIRNYGQTADDKVSNLVSSLGLAILTVVVFVGFFLNWRAALVVALAIPVSYGATLLLDLLFGYTINRVTLFALILALGLIVDDPIASIDNIDRYLRQKGYSRVKAISLAMAEIRGALLMSTLAIVIVFLPMFFITGMMGPYMAPMAFNVPVAVIFSTLVAFFVTPWLAYKLLNTAADSGQYQLETTLMYRAYKRVLSFILCSRRRRVSFLAFIAVLFGIALSLPALRMVPLKLLPHDNKNEFQVVIDLPQGSALEKTALVSSAVSDFLLHQPEVVSVSHFVGLASPMDFNGMVRHYFMRAQPEQSELRVVLMDKTLRREQSNEMITRWRADIEDIASRYHADIQLVEVPPGPPVIATLVAEVYGDAFTPYSELETAADTVAARMRQEAFVTEVTTSATDEHQVWQFMVDREKAALSGIALDDINRTIVAATKGLPIGEMQLADEVSPLVIDIRLPASQRDSLNAILSLYVRGKEGVAQILTDTGAESAPRPLVQLSELGEFKQTAVEHTIYHKNLKPVVYVYGQTVGRVPAEAIADIMADFGEPEGEARPLNERQYVDNGAGLGWDLPPSIHVNWSGEGEWKITLDVFRDLGIAFGVALLGVYAVLVIQTGLPAVSGIIMLAIPLTMIGIMPGFWLLNAFAEDINGVPNPVLFTATAMIGMIALAGIVVRNALVLIEFIHQALAQGIALKEALYQAGAVRMRPILLTAGTTMLGNIVITLDPIFSGLAWAIIFGILASTVFTLLVVPVVYYMISSPTSDKPTSESSDPEQTDNSTQTSDNSNALQGVES